MKITELNSPNSQQIDELRRADREQASVPDKFAEVGHAAAVQFLKSVPSNELARYAVTMTEIPKVGVNPSSDYDTPIGIYFYPAEYYLKKVVRGRLPFQHNAPYIQILKFTTDQILYVGEITAADYERDVKKIQSLNLLSGLSPRDQQVIERLHQESARNAGVKKPGGQLWYVTWKLSDLLEKKYHKASHTIWNWLLRQLGYKLVIDRGSKIVHPSEPTQGLILDSVGSYQWVKTIQNKNKEDVAFRQEFKKNFGQLDYQQKAKIVTSLGPNERVHYFAKYPQLIHFIKDPKLIDKLVGNAVTVEVIKYIKNPSEKLQKLAVRTDPEAIKWIKNPSEELKKFAVQSNGHVIQHIPNPSEELQLIAVKSDGRALQHLANPSKAVQLAAVQQFGGAIKFVDNPSDDIQLAAVQQNGEALQWIRNPTEAVQLAAIRQNGEALQWIRNPTEAMQLAAVRRSGWAIEYITNPSVAVQLAAVKQFGGAIMHITNPSEAVQLAAVRRDGLTIQFISNPSEQVQLAAVQKDYRAIRWITNPSEAVQLAAVQRNSWAIQWIQNPTPKVRALFRELKDAK